MVRKYRFADAAFVVALLLDFASMLLIVDNKLLWGIITFIAVALAAMVRINYPVDLNAMLILFDFSVAFILVAFIYSDICDIPVRWVLPASAGCIVSMLSVLFMRINTNKVKGKVLSVIAFVLVLALSALLISLVANPAGNAVVKLFEMIVQGVCALGKSLYAFMSWLISLLPDAEGELTELPAPQETMQEADIVAAENPLGKVIALLILAAILIFIVWAFLRLRHEKTPRYKAEAKAYVKSRKRPGLRGVLSRLWAFLVHEFRMLIYMTKSNELARYYRLVYRKRFTKEHKKASETPREFIERVCWGSNEAAKCSNVGKNNLVRAGSTGQPISALAVEELLYK